MALPIAIPPDITPKGSRDTRGSLARRLSVSFAPGSIKPGESPLWPCAGYDLIDATVSMAYAIQESTGAVSRGSAETRVTASPEPPARGGSTHALRPLD